MAFKVKSLRELKTWARQIMAQGLGRADPLPDRAPEAILADTVAGLSSDEHAHITYMVKQILPDTAETEWLDRHAASYGLQRTPAAKATGTVTITGDDGTTLPSGATLITTDDTAVATTADATIAGGTAAAAVQAVVAGTGGNLAAATALELVNPVAGLDVAAVVAAGGLTGGVDVESDASLRDRVLFRRRFPPMGGAKRDYESWAKEVAGVDKVFVDPEELGPRSIAVRFTITEAAGGPIPDAAKVTEVQNFLDGHVDELTGVRTGAPVGAEPIVMAPVPISLDLTIRLNTDTAEIRTAVSTNVAAAILRDATPGGTIYLSRISEAISKAAGETSHELLAPAGDVTHNTGEIAVMGAITWDAGA